MTHRLHWIMLSLAFAAAGCGDDALGTQASPATGAPARSAELRCGRELCKLPEALHGEELCCMDTFAGGCGVASGGTCRVFPKLDRRCAAPVAELPLPSGVPGRAYGCCTDQNECGVDVNMGRCIPRSALCELLPQNQASKIKPKTCDGDALPLPRSCGQASGAAGSGG
jgi:hypothetical protein